MKKSAMLLLAVTLLWACNTATSPANESAVHSDAYEHNHAPVLVLNNGQKWRSDAPTNENVKAIRSIAQNFAMKPDAGLPDYEILVSDLQKGLDEMIRECKMSGPDHDALHLWLEPLLKDVNELKSVDDITSAEKTFHAIDERLLLYTQYFE